VRKTDVVLFSPHHNRYRMIGHRASPHGGLATVPRVTSI
jgi:hypothetical protein